VESVELLDVLLPRNGELCPFQEDFIAFGGAAALDPGFDGPGEIGLGVFLQDGVDAFCDEIFGVEEQAVHVEEAGCDWWWCVHRG
jgi:hypothetical protein